MEAEAQEEWVEYKTAEGRQYYHNKTKDVTTWTKPECLKTDEEKAEAELTPQQRAQAEGYDPWENEQYFSSYSDPVLQESMITDTIRTDTYLKSIQTFKDTHFKNKTIIDAGAGTGILSYFSVRDGEAKKVFSIEGSSLADKIKSLYATNFPQNPEKLTVFHGRVEDFPLSLLENEKLIPDTIISEWMGSMLIFEGMLESVIHLRDKLKPLNPNVRMWPSEAKIYFGPVSLNQYWNDKAGHWRNVYGFDYSLFHDEAVENSFTKCIYNKYIESWSNILVQKKGNKNQEAEQQSCLFKTFDLNEMTVSELENLVWNHAFELKNSEIEGRRFHGFAAWFDVSFGEGEQKIVLDTTPGAGDTHWKQELFVLNEEVDLEQLAQGRDIRLSWELEIDRNKYWRRHYNIDIAWKVEAAAKEGGWEMLREGKKTWDRWRAKV